MRKNWLLLCSIPALFYSCSEPLQDNFTPEKSESIEFICYFQKLAQFPGGNDSLRVFIKKNLRWPSPDFCGEGTEVVSFFVETDGSISSPIIRRSLGPLCDRETLRLISIMPIWEPALVDGIPQGVQMNLPIRFKLQ